MSTAIEIRLLAGRFHATPWGRHVNEGVLEWPPSPWRILRAITAGLARAGCDLDTCRRVLQPLLEAPAYRLPPTAAAHIRQYMPWEKTRGKMEKVLVFDAFVVAPDPVTVVWEGTDVDRALLDQALHYVSYLGRSQSWAELRAVRGPVEPNSRPVEKTHVTDPDTEIVRLLAPDPSRPHEAFQALFLTTEEVRAQGLDRPVGTRWVAYARPRLDVDPLPSRARPLRSGGALPTVCMYLVESAARPPLTEALAITDLLRRSAMAWYGRLNQGETSPVLSGKDASGRPLEGHRHAFYLAVDEDDDKRIDRLVLFAAAGLGRAERDALSHVRTLDPGRGRPEIHLHLVGFGGPERFNCRVFGPARRWRSHTPFLLVRHPKVRGTGDAKALREDPVAQVRLELERRGFPRPSSVHIVRGDRFRWLEFRTYRRGDAGPPGAWGFELEFPEEVPGPICLGRLSHFGLGLFLPDVAREEGSR